MILAEVGMRWLAVDHLVGQGEHAWMFGLWVDDDLARILVFGDDEDAALDRFTDRFHEYLVDPETGDIRDESVYFIAVPTRVDSFARPCQDAQKAMLSTGEIVEYE